MTLRPFLLSVPVLLAASVGTVAHAVPVIVNGNFETTSMTASSQITTTNVSSWSTSGYNFLFFPGTDTTTGAKPTNMSYSPLILWSTLPSGASNGIPTAGPDGGNFVGADGDFQVGAITQTVTGLTVGMRYDLSFYWGAAQQKGSPYTSATTEQWQVTLGNELHSTSIINNPSQGFTGWF